MNLKKKLLDKLDIDLLNGPILKSLIIFSIPLVISNIFQQFYNAADTMIVGNYLGDSSLAAVGASAPIFELLIGFAMGIANGLSIVTARSFGAKDENLLKKSVATSLKIGLMSSLAITILGLLLAKPLLTILNTPTNILDDSYSYIFWISLFSIVMFMYNLLGGMLIAIGNAVAPLLFLIFSSILNVGLDIFFITVLKMGVEGAAIATVIAQALSVSLCLLYIYKKEKILIPKKEHFTHDSELFKDMLGQGMSMGFMSSIVSAGSVILQYGINGLGYLTIAGHTAARKLFMMFNIPFGAMAMSMGTFVSQNMGANRYDRIRKGLKSAYLYDLIMAVFVTIILMVFSRDLVKLISGSSDPIVLENGSLYLKVVGPFYAVLGILLQTRVALQGLGLKLLPLISSIIEFFGKILFVLFFIPKFQYLAVIFCEPLIWIVMTIQLVYTFYNHSKIKEAKKA